MVGLKQPQTKNLDKLSKNVAVYANKMVAYLSILLT